MPSERRRIPPWLLLILRACASDFLNRNLPQPQRARLIYAEADASPFLPGRPLRSGVVSAKSLGIVPRGDSGSRRRCGALLGGAGERERLGQVMRFSPRPFTCRGKEVTVLFLHWTSTGRWSRQATPVSAKKG